MVDNYTANSLKFLVNLGLYDVILPFVLIFTIVYAVLEKTNIMGKSKNNINAMIAFVLGFIAISSIQIVGQMNMILSWTSLIMVASVMALIILGTLGIKSVDHPWIKKISLGLALIGSIIIAGNVTGIFEKIKITETIIKAFTGIILVFAFFVALIWWIVKDDNSSSSNSSKSSENNSSSSEIKKKQRINAEDVTER